MTTLLIPRWLIGTIVVVAIPSIACFGYYTLQDMDGSAGRWAPLAILAYPLALIGFVWMMTTCLSAQRTRFRLWASGLCFGVPAIFLLLVHL
jgi:hypothetical protein